MGWAAQSRGEAWVGQQSPLKENLYFKEKILLRLLALGLNKGRGTRYKMAITFWKAIPSVLSLSTD